MHSSTITPENQHQIRDKVIQDVCTLIAASLENPKEQVDFLSLKKTILDKVNTEYQLFAEATGELMDIFGDLKQETEDLMTAFSYLQIGNILTPENIDLFSKIKKEAIEKKKPRSEDAICQFEHVFSSINEKAEDINFTTFASSLLEIITEKNEDHQNTYHSLLNTFIEYDVLDDETTIMFICRLLPQFLTIELAKQQELAEHIVLLKNNGQLTADNIQHLDMTDLDHENWAETENTKNVQHEEPVIAYVKACSLFEAIKSTETGARAIDGWILKDVDDNGDCFYLAVIDQLKIINHTYLDLTDNDIDLLPLLRISIDSPDNTWADIKEIFAIAKLLDVIICIVDTRAPANGFRTYYYDFIQNKQEESYDHCEALEKPILRLAYTGNHYLSVRTHPNLERGAVRKEFSIKTRDDVFQLESQKPYHFF